MSRLQMLTGTSLSTAPSLPSSEPARSPPRTTSSSQARSSSGERHETTTTSAFGLSSRPMTSYIARTRSAPHFMSHSMPSVVDLSMHASRPPWHASIHRLEDGLVKSATKSSARRALFSPRLTRSRCSCARAAMAPGAISTPTARHPSPTSVSRSRSKTSVELPQPTSTTVAFLGSERDSSGPSCAALRSHSFVSSLSGELVAYRSIQYSSDP
mmetsp:Transcript_13162/g.33727  ORF Transcript_13162/g.33727 Transcript_13162/m.33727 type:complete len:213 (-) Transcript_13162:113-751(-)